MFFIVIANENINELESLSKNKTLETCKGKVVSVFK
jgi:hypothetical protein